jgi:ABC-type multidrug transport system ATPase subunit
MSEEILEHLMKLFGIIAKQGGGASDIEVEFVSKFLKSQLGDAAVEQYLDMFKSEANKGVKFDDRGRLIVAVGDSMKVLGICRKANKALTKEQKVVVLVRLYEMEKVYTDGINAGTVKVSLSTDEGNDMAAETIKLREEVIKTAGEVFNLEVKEIDNIKLFCNQSDPTQFDLDDFLVADEKEEERYQKAVHVKDEKLDGYLSILQIKSANLYFVKYEGDREVSINGLTVDSGTVYPLPSGSFIKTPSGQMYYTDIVARLAKESNVAKISFEVKDLCYVFKTGGIGLRHINMAEEQGKLVGIMGASGAGKTTLLNVLCGTESPTTGEVLINGLNLHTQKEQLEGVIGLIPQDDLLIEELTVYQNLYYSAKLCFKSLSEKEIEERVNKTLTDLGLYERRHLQVGSPLNKMISGGQRKRLNIALELIREPGVLFVDEPTSGLSSRDSENVMNLLRELSLKGKLVFVVIHQPSSDIYKMFDKMFILDTGGYPVYYGNPTESITYFKREDGQANADMGQCPTCGNVNPEQVFNILDASVRDEFGNTLNKRKKTAEEWNKTYNEKILPNIPKVKTVEEKPPKSLDIPSWIKQFWIYTQRDFWAKVSNTQYTVLNVLEAPVLGFVLAYLIRYIVDPDSDIYIFRENANIPIYIFMGTVVAIFFGLIVSAEEIFKDAKILKREAFLNLSRSAYLMSKIVILMGLSAIQMILFILVGNAEIEFADMNWEFWVMLFSVAVSSNILGLIISSTFNSIVTIYIMIPLIMIPQMVLGGAMFTFDKLNKDISSVDKVPLVAEIIPARYAYEGLIVHQYKNNKFEKRFFEHKMRESQCDFKQVYYLPKLKDALENVMNLKKGDKTDDKSYTGDLALLSNELGKEMRRNPGIAFEAHDGLTPEAFDKKVYDETKAYFTKLEKMYQDTFMLHLTERERMINYYLSNDETKATYNRLKDACFNEAVSDVVTKTFDKNKILRDGDRLIQIKDPIYQMPEPEGILRFRSHFFAPKKYFFGTYIETLWFNVLAVWLISAFLYVLLYYDVVRKTFEKIGDLKLDKKIEPYVKKAKEAIGGVWKKMRAKKAEGEKPKAKVAAKPAAKKE